MIKKQPFVNYGITEELNKPISVKITENERIWLVEAKRIIQQPKTSTALKQLAEIGFKQVLLDNKTRAILETVLTNIKRNDRTGITDREFEI